MLKICIYHKSCLDGFTSAWVVNHFYNSHYRENIDFYAANYNDKELPDVKGKDVIIVDFSYKRDVLVKMASEANTIVILDHHKSARDDLDGLVLFNSTIIFDMDRSGAMITWDYFYPDDPAPQLIKHVQDHDLWLFKLENTKEVIAALYSYEFDFGLWEYMSKNLNQLYIEGDALLRDKLKTCNQLTKHPQLLYIAGFKIPAVNCSAKYSSDIGNMLSLYSPFAATYYINENFDVMFSLRSNKEYFDYSDVSEIAKQYGGGGHYFASGFSCSMQQLLEFING